MTKRNIKTFNDDLKPDITKNQQLIYHYILSLSTFDPEKKLYYVPKTSVVATKIGDRLGLCRQVVSKGIKDLEAKGYIQLVDDFLKSSHKPAYVIYPYMTPYVGLDVDLIKFLIEVARLLQEDLKHIVSVYCLLCRYYEDIRTLPDDDDAAYFTLVNLARVFEGRTSNKYNNHKYLTLMSIFSGAKLIDLSWERREIKGKNGGGIKTIYFRIRKIRTTLPQEIKEVLENEEYCSKCDALLQKYIDTNTFSEQV